MSKSKIARVLLWSLIPAFALVLLMALFTPSDNENVGLIGGLTVMYMMVALPLGLYLRWKGRKEDAVDDAQRYAERNGWHPISEFAWRSRKREGAALAVSRVHKGSTYIFTIEYQGETTTVDEFSRADWALQFGDWLWTELRESAQDVDMELIQEKRQEWEETRAMAVYGDR